MIELVLRSAPTTVTTLEEVLIAGAITVGVAIFAATYRLGTAIGGMTQVQKMLLANDKEHDDRDLDHERRISRLEGRPPRTRSDE